MLYAVNRQKTLIKSKTELEVVCGNNKLHSLKMERNKYQKLANEVI